MKRKGIRLIIIYFYTAKFCSTEQSVIIDNATCLPNILFFSLNMPVVNFMKPSFVLGFILL